MRAMLRSGLVTAVTVLLLCSPTRSQNGTNYHITTNGPDVIFIGVGAGGTQTAADGLGTWIAGEDLKGSHMTALGDFGFRMPNFRESLCLTQPGPGGVYTIQFPALAFLEFDGLNGNAPPIFTNPACTIPSFPLGSSGVIPYGTGPTSSASFLLGTILIPSAAPFGNLLLPEHGLVGGAPGTVNILAAATGVSLPAASVAACYDVSFTWVPSALPLNDDIDGLWHWVRNSPDNNQYWQMSDNEMNIWQSQSVLLDQGTQAVGFTANVDYALLIGSRDPETIATLSTRGFPPAGAYYGQTANVSDEFGFSFNPNMGFDAGMGSRAVSFSALAGVPNPTTGLGNQDPSNNPGTTTTLGFATMDNGGDGNGSVRLTWLSVDLLGFSGGNPATDPGIIVNGLRAPLVSAGFLQPLTNAAFPLFGHVTQPGWPDPHGPGGGGVGPHIGGASNQIPLGALPPSVCVGVAINVTYGTSGRLGDLGTPGGITWDPSIADVSGTRELFLFD
jgi:hypothetical protein